MKNPDDLPKALDSLNQKMVQKTHSSIARLSKLREGQKVSYEIQTGRDGKSSAENLSVIE